MVIKIKHRNDKSFDVVFVRDERWTATVCNSFETARILKDYVDRVFDFGTKRNGESVFELMKLTYDETIVFTADDKIYYETIGCKGYW